MDDANIFFIKFSNCFKKIDQNKINRLTNNWLVQKEFLHTAKTDFSMRAEQPHSPRCERKSAFFHAGSATAWKNWIFAWVTYADCMRK